MNIKQKIKDLEKQIIEEKRWMDYYNAEQLASKLCLNQTYGAFATPYFILFNNQVAATITSEGRRLTRTMSEVNETYWYTMWHEDKVLHKKMNIKDVKQIKSTDSVSVYGDTDSIFVGFEPAINSCKWRNLFLCKEKLESIKSKFYIIGKYVDKKHYKLDFKFDNDNFLGYIEYHDELDDDFSKGTHLIIDGRNIKDKKLWEFLDKNTHLKYVFNWTNELDFIHGIDHFRIAEYFKECLDKHAESYGVENKEDFELEKISDANIYMEKKKYIQHITFEDGVYYNPLEYFQPKGVELIRSSSPSFARDKETGIYRILKYLFSKPKDFNIQELNRLAKEIRNAFEMAYIDDICGQSSVSKYHEKVIDDKDKVETVKGAHFAVKAAANYNFLLNKRTELKTKYDFIHGGDKIKIYYTTNPQYPIFGYRRGQHPYEFAPDVDYDKMFSKVILSPINSIITKVGLPKINRRLSVLEGIFSNF